MHFFHFIQIFSLISLINGQASSTLNRIKHVVVLVLENRSFDHMLGFVPMPGADNLLNKQHLFNYFDLSNRTSDRVFVGTGAPFAIPQDPGHYVSSVTEQIYGNRRVQIPYPDPAPMNGFLQDAYYLFNKSKEAATNIMKSFKPEDVHPLATLAQEYAVFDRWFASVPGPTQPNRAFIHSATANGEIDNQRWHMRLGYPQKTIYESLHESGKDFRLYYHDGPTAGLFRWMRRPDILLGKFRKYDGVLAGLGGFRRACKQGDLKELTFIDPRYFDHKKLFGGHEYANDDHPPHDIRRGQSFIKEVYETLRASPQWKDSLLIITYDEHGGFYDHVPPPTRGVPNPDGKMGDGISFDRLGIRVPTVMISPWIKKGTVVHRPPNGPYATSQYEHSSIPATLKKLFNLKNFLTKRDAWAGTFEHVWSELSTPRQDCPEKLPNPPSLRRRSLEDEKIDEAGPLTDMQEALVEMVGGMVKNNTKSVDLSKRDAREFVVKGWESIMMKK